MAALAPEIPAEQEEFFLPEPVCEIRRIEKAFCPTVKPIILLGRCAD